MSHYKVYEVYKHSGVEWLGSVPAHWAAKRAKFIFQLAKRPARDEDGIVTAFRDGQVTLRVNRRTEGFTNAVKEIGYQGVRQGDLVIHAMDAFAGAVGESESDGKCSPVYSCCTPNIGVDVGYYARLVRTMAITGFIESLAKGIRERSTDFRWSDFAELTLPLPPEGEQKTIAAQLDRETTRIDALINKKTRFIELLREKRQALITHAVTKGLDPTVKMKDSGVTWLGDVPEHWSVRPFKFCIDFQEGPGIMAADFQSEGVPLIRISGVQTDRVTLSGCNYLDPGKVAQQWSHFKLKSADLLISGSASMGNIAEVDDEAAGSIAYTGLIRLREKGVMSKEFMRWALASTIFSTQVDLFKAGSTIQHFGPTHLSQMFLVVPPIQEQGEIARSLMAQVAKFDFLCQKTERSIELLKERRSALITAAVTGQIDLREAA